MGEGIKERGRVLLSTSKSVSVLNRWERLPLVIIVISCQDNSDMGGGVRMNREIPSSTLATLRGILVSSLSRENLGPNDLSTIHENVRLRPPRKVHFREEHFLSTIKDPIICRKENHFA
ncbi:hypothetical protein HZH66_002897 [Vespula vulgaris]|uniref:Uncharacterized protein n=1 Tax=Vespula vulgaris TaxID=7454 RepID=A0A834NFL8_VESVU|nr:hypothetical protein HZH66_002897 [Vespula vulgaris]